MKDTSVMYRPIGVIHSVHRIAAQAPIQPLFAKHCTGQIELFPEFETGLDDLEGFSHIYLLYHLHKAGPVRLKLKPFLQNVEHGVLATRAPSRPNAIGLSIVELINREKNILHINNVDMLDGTPLLDIKPYTGKFDHVETTRCGWLDEVEAEKFSGGSQRVAGA